MTEKELFDQVFAGMEKQFWARCLDSTGECVYSSGQRRCPVGHAMTLEEIAQASRIRGPIVELNRQGAFPERLMPFWSLLKEMQDLHDTAEDWQTAAQLKKHFEDLGEAIKEKVAA